MWDFIDTILNPLGLSYFVFVLLGVILIVFGVLDRKAQQRKTILRQLTDINLNKNFLDKWLDKISIITKIEEKLDLQLSVMDIRYSARAFTKVKLAGAFVGVLISIYFRNWMISVPMVLICIELPTMLIQLRVKKRLKVFDDQILEAYQVFITDFTTSGSATKTLSSIPQKLRNPLRKEFERLARRLNSGLPVEDCFMDFAERTQNRWTLIFAQMMITYYRDGGEFTEHLMNITKNITSDKILAEQNTTELSSLQMVNLITNALVPVAYITNRWLNPEDFRVFIDTSSGKMMMVWVVVSCLISLYASKRLTNA